MISILLGDRKDRGANKIICFVSTNILIINNKLYCKIKIRGYSARLRKITVLLFNTLITKCNFMAEKLR